MTQFSPAGRFDRYEVLTDCRSAFLDHLTTLLRNSRLLSEAAIGAIVRGTGDHFDKMQLVQRSCSFAEEASGLTSSRITLVGEDDLELEIRFERLCKRLTESTSVSLWKTHLRFMTLLGRNDLPKAQNPVGPLGIVAGIQALFEAAGASSLEEKISLLDRIENVLHEGLPPIYDELDALLSRAGAEAMQPVVGDNLRPTVVPLRQEVPPTADPTTAAALTQLVGIPGKSTSGGKGLLNQAALDNLMFRLEQLERSQRNSTDFLTATSPKLESLLPGLFDGPQEIREPSLQPVRAQELGVPPATAEGQAIDAVGHFYATIFSDPDLPDAQKQLVAELQVFMVRLALKDKSLFSREDHPLRLLIDQIGRVFLGLPTDARREHPWCRKISAIIGRLKDGFGGHAESITTAIEALRQLQQEQLREIGAEAAPYLPLLQKLEQGDQLATDMDCLLGSREIASLPPVLQVFFQHEWKRLLEKAWHEGGVNGAPWQELARTLSTLLWSFQPKVAGEERQAMARQLPGVLKSFKNDMDRLGMDADAQSRVLDACFELQTRAMRGGAMPPPHAGIGSSHRQQASQGRIEAGDLILHTLDFPAPANASPQGQQPAVGSWLGLRLDGLEHKLCLCYRSPHSGRCLLYSPDSRMALAIHPQLMECRLVDGGMRRLKPALQFADLLAQAMATAD